MTKYITIRYGNDSLDHLEYEEPLQLANVINDAKDSGKSFSPTQASQLNKPQKIKPQQQTQQEGNTAPSASYLGGKTGDPVSILLDGEISGTPNYSSEPVSTRTTPSRTNIRDRNTPIPS